MSMRYDDYLQTDRWKDLAALVKKNAGYRCVLCNCPDALVAHHRTYERVGRERLSDLTCLCDPCHQLWHQHRKLWVDSLSFKPQSGPSGYVGMARAKKAPETALEDAFTITGTGAAAAKLNEGPTAMVDQQNKKRIRQNRDAVDYMQKIGVHPKHAGWRDRMVGRIVPVSLFG
jgi:hypothetical protein